MIIRNGLLYLIARLLPGALAVVTTAILTRLLTPQSYGLYGLTLMVMNFGSTIAFEWLGLSFMRFFETRKEDPRAIPTFVVMYYVMVGLTGLILLLVLPSGLIPHEQLGLCVVGLCMAWSFAFFELLARFEVASFRPGRFLMLNLTRAALLMVFTLGAAWWTREPLPTALGNAVGLLVALVPLGRKRLALRPALFDKALAREVLRFGVPFALSMMLAGMFTSGVRLLVATLTDTDQLGLYTAAYSLSQNVLFVVAGAINSTIYPLAVRAYERGDPAALRAQMEDNFALLVGTLAPASIGMMLTAPGLAQQLVGPDFRAGVAQMIPWMALTVLLGSFRGNYLDHSFQLGKRSAHQVTVSAVAAVLALLGTAVLVPVLGGVGAPIATSIAMLISCVHAWLLGRSGQKMPLPLRPLAQVCCSTAVMAAAVMAVPNDLTYGLYLKVVAGMAAYVVTSIAVDLLRTRRKVLAILTGGAGYLRRRASGSRTT